ncbi:radical SAM protein [Actinoplanes sp. NEAU-A12]|uniref:Radical SAM protein n=1 Tax=Actinoplanes sandaracinus TaxID=3045177 RepID=A0ABT6WX85_9ACTN|nr:radical SAM/SPASM domain-containing protein [Actinoplanes sandaracinus]MDI6104352.1 radical SAM protein [Actinoplanes sandaracinus]
MRSAVTVASPVAVMLPRYVEVETSRRCNRTCQWCPNAENDARRTQQVMEWGLFRRVVDELGAAGFDGVLAFHNYNEPLLNPRILDEIGYVRAVAAAAKPAIYSNGDMLDKALFDRLIAAGVAYLRVTRYPHEAQTPASYEAITSWLRQKGLTQAADWRFEPVRQGLAGLAELPTCRVEVISPQIIEAYNHRGGSVTSLPLLARQRTEPCLMTATSAVIDYLGRLKMCCCVYPEAPAHAGYVIGSLAEPEASLLDLWGSEQMNAYRQAHARAEWSLSPACGSCTQPLPETRR